MTTSPSLEDNADSVYEALRAICHRTGGGTGGATLPAPRMYTILGSLQAAGHLLPQALQQLADALERSLEAYDVYEFNDLDPAESVAAAKERLLLAAQLAGEMATHLSDAQSAIAGQGYRDPADG